MSTKDLATPAPAGDADPFVRVYTYSDGRAIIALDAAAVDQLLYYLDDLGPGYDLTQNPGAYGVDQDAADLVTDVVGRITAPLRSLYK